MEEQEVIDRLRKHLAVCYKDTFLCMYCPYYSKGHCHDDRLASDIEYILDKLDEVEEL